MDKPIIRLRPHHALCLRHFIGKGYDDAFVKNMHEIHMRLESGEREMVQIILHRDSLCGPCPHQIDAACEREDWVQSVDRSIAGICQLKSGQWLPWRDLCAIIDAHMFEEERWAVLCVDCQWYELCRKVRQQKNAG